MIPTKIIRFVRSGAVLAAIGLAASTGAQINNSQSPLDPPSTNSGNNSNNNNSNNQRRDSVQPDNPYVGQETIRPFDANDQTNSPLSRRQSREDGVGSGETLTRVPSEPGEYELYIERVLGRRLPRFGEKLVLPALRDFAAPATATVPPEYIVQPGDSLVISLSGSMEGSVARFVDNNGAIFLPGVGSVKVAGVRHSDLRETLAAAIGTQFRGFTISVNIAELRGIRVYVTGLANNPGAFTVGSLSTIANAVFQAGGPSAGGSWRTIKVYRNGQEVGDFDLYQLMRGGNRVKDVQLQNEDVLFIPPAGPQVAVFGSVQEEAIYEAKPGESVADMLAAAGGPNTVADRSRLIVYSMSQGSTPGPQEFNLQQARLLKIQPGDIVQLLSAGTLAMPVDRQSVLVRIEGEVAQPGTYYFPPNTPFSQVIAKAGGMTGQAFPYGIRFIRQSVKLQQQQSFREGLQQLEVTVAAAPLTSSSSVSDSQRNAQIAGAQSVIEKLRNVQPDGRVVLNVAPDGSGLPDRIALENNDTIYIPPRPSTIGVFGAVYRPASFLIGGGKPMPVLHYLEQAGGTLRIADVGGTFLVRANGEVVSTKRGALRARVLPGDVVFVPIKTQSGTFWAKFKDITQTLFQLGLSAATVVAVTK
ncbi:MAG: SLBB domain-containing protein [Pseudomonadota bacterium]